MRPCLPSFPFPFPSFDPSFHFYMPVSRRQDHPGLPAVRPTQMHGSIVHMPSAPRSRGAKFYCPLFQEKKRQTDFSRNLHGLREVYTPPPACMFWLLAAMKYGHILILTVDGIVLMKQRQCVRSDFHHERSFTQSSSKYACNFNQQRKACHSTTLFTINTDSHAID